MRAVVFLAAFWLMPFLFFGWRTWWPSKQERERQREISKLYDCHFRAATPPILQQPQVNAGPATVGRKCNLPQSAAAHALTVSSVSS
jgi:hypothetical protein